MAIKVGLRQGLIENKSEQFVRWYLRFNGYLGAENFVIHGTGGRVVPQDGEFDILAVRFPHSKEIPGFELKVDSRLLDREAVGKHLTDFIIAEVKSGKSASLNSVWRGPDDKGNKRNKLAYLLRWLGCLGRGDDIERSAAELQSQHRSIAGRYLFRLVYFGKRHSTQGVPQHVPQITFRQIAEFFVIDRGPCWQERQMGRRSHHDQWPALVKNTFEIASPEDTRPREEKINAILRLLV